MSYSTELYFDQDSENKIKEYLNIIKREGIENLFYNLGALPHISLAVYNDNIDHLELIKNLEKFRLNKVKISFKNIGYFCSNENAIFLCPKINYELLDLHKSYHEEFKEYIKNEGEYYLPENWIPHCSIAFEVSNEDFIKTIRILKNDFEPIDVTIEKIGFIRSRPIEKLYLKSF